MLPRDIQPLNAKQSKEIIKELEREPTKDELQHTMRAVETYKTLFIRNCRQQ